jgi:hypothetical protein
MTHVLVALGVILFALAFAGILWVLFIGELAADLPDEDEENGNP